MRERDGRDRAGRVREHGNVIIFWMMAMTALMGIAAWATETGRMWQVKSQLQAIADTAALAAVSEMFGNDFTTISRSQAQSGAQSLALEHSVLGAPVSIPGFDVQPGSWDMENQTFTPSSSTDPDEVRAVRVITRRDSTANREVPTILGGIYSLADPTLVKIAVNSDAIAYWGYAGRAATGVVDLPIAIDCCAVAGDASGSPCAANYCDEISANPPNSSDCPLAIGGSASCLQFTSGPEENACWTEFNGSNGTITNVGLQAEVEAGNTRAISGPIYVAGDAQGTVVDRIKARFEGTAPFSSAAGSDLIGDDDVVDSWVVRLPLIACQNPGPSCAGSDPQNITGFVCFEVQEVVADGPSTPGGEIKGRFLCSSDSRCTRDGLGPGGTVKAAISAQSPVIVE